MPHCTCEWGSICRFMNQFEYAFQAIVKGVEN